MYYPPHNSTLVRGFALKDNLMSIQLFICSKNSFVKCISTNLKRKTKERENRTLLPLQNNLFFPLTCLPFSLVYIHGSLFYIQALHACCVC